MSHALPCLEVCRKLVQQNAVHRLQLDISCTWLRHQLSQGLQAHVSTDEEKEPFHRQHH